MSKILGNYKRYTVSEWLTLVLGLAILVIQIYRYATNQLGNYPLVVELFAFCAGALLLIAPKSINDLIRKSRGVDVEKKGGQDV